MNIVLFEEEELSRPLPPTDRRATHITDILRLGPGGEFRAGVVDGAAGIGRVRRIDPEGRVEIELELGSRDGGRGGPNNTPPLHQVRLLLGHPRPIVLKRMLRDLSTLGVERIVVVRTELGEKSYLESKIWQGDTVRRLLIEGAEQAGSTVLPLVDRAWSLEAAAETVSSGLEEAERVLFDNEVPDAEVPVGRPAGLLAQPRGAEGVSAACGRICAVGSERGWTDAERVVLAKLGFGVRNLGRRVLRTETAAIAAVSISVGEMEYW